MLIQFARFATFSSLASLAACSSTGTNRPSEHTDHEPAASGRVQTVPVTTSLPADAGGARARLAISPRHGEWVTVSSGADSIRAWVVYPERKTKAPVIIVVHEIFGLTPWVRAVADQLAADGFIAIAPNLLTMKNLPNATDSVPGQLATSAADT